MPQEQDPTQSEPLRRNARSQSSEEIDARFLRSMLYEPLPGSAAVILAQLGIIEEGQIEALGARTYDAESARLSLALDDGRTVELERAMHLHTENGYAVRIRSRAGQTISRSFIHIDRDLGVRNLHNDRMVYIDDTDSIEPSEAEIEAAADQAYESQSHELYSQTPHRQAERFHHQPDPASEPKEDATAAPAEEQAASVSEAPVSEPPAGEAVACEETSIGPPAVAASIATAQASDALIDAAPENSSEMPEILPEGEVATIIYFHEIFVPGPGEAAESESPTGIALAPPETVTAPENPVPQDSTSQEPESQASFEGTAIAAAETTVPVTVVAAGPITSGFVSAEALTAAEDSAPELAAAPETPAATAEAAPSAAPDPEPITRSEPEPSALAPESHPDYAPLHAALAPPVAADFLFIAQTGTIYTYEHRQTFRYIHIDAPSGLFYDQTRTPISRAAALKRVLAPQSSTHPAAPGPSSEPSPAPAEQSQTAPQPSSQSPPPVPAHSEPELRVRTTYTARAAVKPEPAPETQLTPSDQAPSFDAFTRKHGSPLDRDSWRDRIADLSRALRLGRNSNGSNGNHNS